MYELHFFSFLKSHSFLESLMFDLLKEPPFVTRGVESPVGTFVVCVICDSYETV